MKKIFILLLCFFCARNVYCNEINYDNVPVWYEIKVENNKINLYGNGYGSSKKEAIKQAIDNIIDPFLHGVEPVVIDKDLENDDEYINNLNNDLFSKEINNYIIEKIEYVNGDCFVLVSIKRKDLFYYYYQKFTPINDEINSKFRKLLNSDLINYKKIATVLEIYIEYAKKFIKIMSNIEKFNDNDYYEYYDSIILNTDYHYDSLNITSLIKDEKFKYIADIVRDAIVVENIFESEYSDNNIEIEVKSKQKKLENTYILDFNIILTLKFRNEVVNYKRINFIEKSDKNYTDIYIKLKNDIEKYFVENDNLEKIFK